MGTVGYLLDTHTFLWAVHEKGSRLSDNVRELLNSADAPIYVSAVSAYEIMYKFRIGKLPDYSHVAENYLNILKMSDANELSISTTHAHYAGSVNWEHRDPFDRMLAAQAYIDNLTLITNDPAFKPLSWVTVLW